LQKDEDFQIVALAVFTYYILSALSKLGVREPKPYVVLSLDAFRWDYDSIYGTVLDDIAVKG
jgi:hypothetical protein